jgi:DNA excision repair protein ERCC-2
MQFSIDGLPIYWPFEVVYKEQYEYLKVLKRVMDAATHGIVEMPTGSGKTISLFSFVYSYKHAFPDKISKVVFCTRTLSQLQKATEEMRKVEEYFRHHGLPTLKAQVLSARRNLCINPLALESRVAERVDSACKRLSKFHIPKPCTYFDTMETTPDIETLRTVQTMNIEDLLAMGEKNHVCPYYTSRKFMEKSDIILCNYPYVIDPNSNGKLMDSLDKKSLIIIDEAHNIDNNCVDSLTHEIDNHMIAVARKNLDSLKDKCENVIQENYDLLEREYQKIVGRAQGVASKPLERVTQEDIKSANMIPGNLRKAEHFFNFIRRLLTWFHNFVKRKNNEVYDPEAFLFQMKMEAQIDEQSLKFCKRRLELLLATITYLEFEEIVPLTLIFGFCETLVTYQEGFKIIYEPFYDTGKKIMPVIKLVCLDSTLGMKLVLDRIGSLVLTSGTMTPMDMYERILGLPDAIKESLQPAGSRKNISPLVVTRGTDGTPLSTSFTERANTMVYKNYGELLLEASRTIPDGIVMFFPSYHYMEETVNEWMKTGLVEQILRHKLIFLEKKNQTEMDEVIQDFKEAIRRGRGAVFICVARGKVSEGIDFKDHLGRCSIVAGIPYQYTKSRALLCRTEYLEKRFGLSPGDFITFDAIRQTAQCLGRVVRGKNDFGVMILADARYNEAKLSALPEWIRTQIVSDKVNLHISVAKVMMRKFHQAMSTAEDTERDSYYLQEDLTE